MEKTSTTKKGKGKAALLTTAMASNRDFIQPLVKEAGKNHPIEDLHDKGEMPTLVATGITNLNPLKGRQWISYKITFKGATVISLEVSEPGSMEDARMGAVVDFQLNLESVME